jgi:hypothetical protein
VDDLDAIKDNMHAIIVSSLTSKSAVQEFFRTGIMPDGFNDTFIVLIPKSKNPVCLRDFRPISLCP